MITTDEKIEALDIVQANVTRVMVANDYISPAYLSHHEQRCLDFMQNLACVAATDILTSEMSDVNNDEVILDVLADCVVYDQTYYDLAKCKLIDIEIVDGETSIKGEFCLKIADVLNQALDCI